MKNIFCDHVNLSAKYVNDRPTLPDASMMVLFGHNVVQYSVFSQCLLLDVQRLMQVLVRKTCLLTDCYKELQ